LSLTIVFASSRSGESPSAFGLLDQAGRGRGEKHTEALAIRAGVQQAERRRDADYGTPGRLRPMARADRGA
jgi:hypothetical protein